eukprot:Phypoly_transcript_16840.p1 GENE.Phypoly_transcript_16840~~Phypoly_transcript_16840.p1  ORF type:complete len:234 (+),score=58.86 Phypoly_transcript_16840:44-703(+)
MTEKVENRFDIEAAKWDEKPTAVEIAKKSSQALLDHIPFAKDMNVMDFGCGTGLISEAILPKVHSVFGVDASQGMVDIFNKKIETKKLQNTIAAYVFLTGEDQLGGRKFDVIYSSFALHHVEDITKMIQILASYLTPGGYLGIVDLEKTDKTPLFHAKSKHADVYHHGFLAQDLEQSVDACGQFTSVKTINAFSITKDLDDIPGESVAFGALLLVCKKK